MIFAAGPVSRNSLWPYHSQALDVYFSNFSHWCFPFFLFLVFGSHGLSHLSLSLSMSTLLVALKDKEFSCS